MRFTTLEARRFSAGEARNRKDSACICMGAVGTRSVVATKVRRGARPRWRTLGRVATYHGRHAGGSGRTPRHPFGPSHRVECTSLYRAEAEPPDDGRMAWSSALRVALHTRATTGVCRHRWSAWPAGRRAPAFQVPQHPTPIQRRVQGNRNTAPARMISLPVNASLLFAPPHRSPLSPPAGAPLRARLLDSWSWVSLRVWCRGV